MQEQALSVTGQATLKMYIFTVKSASHGGAAWAGLLCQTYVDLHDQAMMMALPRAILIAQHSPEFTRYLLA